MKRHRRSVPKPRRSPSVLEHLNAHAAGIDCGSAERLAASTRAGVTSIVSTSAAAAFEVTANPVARVAPRRIPRAQEVVARAGNDGETALRGLRERTQERDVPRWMTAES